MAFNNVTFEVTNGSLSKLGIPLILTEWMDVMLSSRIINSRIEECSVRISVTRGTTQEDDLSPILWLLVINSKLKDLRQTGTKVMSYADGSANCRKIPGNCLSSYAWNSWQTIKVDKLQRPKGEPI